MSKKTSLWFCVAADTILMAINGFLAFVQLDYTLNATNLVLFCISFVLCLLNTGCAVWMGFLLFRHLDMLYAEGSDNE